MPEVIDTSNLSSSSQEQSPASEESEKRVEKAKDFLSQPNVQASPFNRRVNFLKSKGLTLQEIHTAFAAVGQPKEMKEIEDAATNATATAAPTAPRTTSPVKPSSPQVTGEVYQPRSLQPKAPQQQQPQDLTWKDYFIGTTVALGSAFGLKCLADQFLDIDVRWKDPKRKVRKEKRELPPLPNEAIRKIGEMETKMEKIEAASKTSTETVTEMKTFVDSKVRPEIASLAAKLEGRVRMIERLGERLGRVENDKLKTLEQTTAELKTAVTELKKEITVEAPAEEAAVSEDKTDEKKDGDATEEKKDDANKSTEQTQPPAPATNSLVADAPKPVETQPAQQPPAEAPAGQ
eukprot:TRINITY_DN6570_c0_g1_i1.p1 TRINITY_DN6570_c0_g1~~TRINITY_DN6570_c0_g1_i1.p1  ORF type:complete len:348 (+),score=103.98 TRINITY_DN6570_c0_g1_i1:76-1119(+)